MSTSTKKISRVSVVTNGSNSQKPKSTTTQSKETITQPQKQFLQKKLCLLEGHCGLEQLPKGKIEYDKKIGEGGFGIIVKGTLQPKHHKPINIVIKKPKLQGADKRTKEKIKQALESETDISSNIIKTAKQNFGINNNLISSQEGLANISLQQKATYNRHIQKYTHGQNGFDAIHNKKLDLYYTQTGHPKNIKQPLMLAQQLLNAIHALHEQEVAHCDIKPGNIMLEMTDNNPKLTIIDLGGAAKFGQQATIISKNAAPETQIAWQMYNRLATSPEDIYATGTVLCESLFGKNNKKWTQIFFNPNNIQNMQVLVKQCVPTVITKKLDTGYYPDQEQPETYLRNLLQKANRLSDVENLYPPAIYNAIEDLIVRMCAIEPEDRPSAQYCLAVLNDLALCDHDAIRNDTTGKIKPMVVCTTSQAVRLISNLNELNKKAELTQKEKETKEVLIYNLKRDFDTSQETTELKTALKNAIKYASEGKKIPSETLQQLSNKQRSTLQDLKTKLDVIDTQQAKKLKEKIDTLLEQTKRSELLNQSKINELSTEVDIEVNRQQQQQILLNLQTELQLCDMTQQTKDIEKNITEAIQKVQSGELLNQSEINKLKTEVDINVELDSTSDFMKELQQYCTSQWDNN